MHLKSRITAIFLATILCVVAMTQTSSARGLPVSFAPIIKKVLPSVVNIKTEITQTVTTNTTLPGLPPEFRQFFPELPPQKQTRKGFGAGSGFVINANKGYIITNYHVIDHATKITVIFHDKETAEAKIVGSDKKTDIAVLQIDTKKLHFTLTASHFGDSSKSEMGDWVLAAGNPFGIGTTVTSGIISAMARDAHFGPYDNFIQTDAALNPGNSGGPLYNIEGEVIGINSMIVSPRSGQSSGFNVGIGFAIDGNLAKGIIKQLIDHGVVNRSWIGISLTDVTKPMAAAVGLKRPRGALVVEVLDKSPASKAKLHRGDIILKFDGKNITDSHTLPMVVANTQIGKRVIVQIWRHGRTLNLILHTSKMKVEATKATAPVVKKKDQHKDKVGSFSKELGVKVVPLTDKEIAGFHLPKGVNNGVKVTEVKDKSVAAAAGITNNMLILAINSHDVHTAHDLDRVIKAAKSRHRRYVTIFLWAYGHTIFTTLDLHPKK